MLSAGSDFPKRQAGRHSRQYTSFILLVTYPPKSPACAGDFPYVTHEALCVLGKWGAKIVKVFKVLKDFKVVKVIIGITAPAALSCRDPQPAGGILANETRYKQQIVHLERCFL